LNCKVRGRPLASGNLVPLRTCRAAANLQNQSYRTTLPTTPSDSLTAAQSAMAAVNNHPATQNLKDTVANGEVSLAPISPALACLLTSSCDTVPKSPFPSTSPALRAHGGSAHAWSQCRLPWVNTVYLA
jgi:hypothetical protein